MVIDLVKRACFKIDKMLFITVMCFPVFAFSQLQKPGSIGYLTFCNGLNGIALGSDINQIPGYKPAFLDGDDKLDADSCLKFEIRDYDLLKMGTDLKLDLIGLRTYKNKIVNIYLFFKKRDGYKMLSRFLTAYGPFTTRPDDYADLYDWNSSVLKLSLKYQLETDLGVAILTSKPLTKKIGEMKEKAETRRNLEQFAARYGTAVTHTFGEAEAFSFTAAE